MTNQRTVFTGNSIEFTGDGKVNKARIVDSIGHLLIYAGRCLLDIADNRETEIPQSFEIIRELDGWDMNFKLVMKMEQRQEDDAK